MEILSPIIGFTLGAILVLTIWRLQQVSFPSLGTVTLGNIQCYAGGTMLRIPYMVTGGTPAEIRAMTYNSTTGTPEFGDATPVSGNPIELPYSASSSHDRVVVFATFPASPANGLIPTSSSCGSGGGSGGSMARNSRTVLP